MEATCDTTCDIPSVSDSSSRSKEEGIQYYLEYYFSQENLSKDRYLKRQMDSDGYVPISILLRFNKMINYRASHDDIVDAARRSSLLKLDKTSSKIKAHSLDYIVELRIIDDKFTEKDVWEQILIPNGISDDQCESLTKADGKWSFYTDDKITAIDCVGKLRSYEARLRHRVLQAYPTRRAEQRPPLRMETQPMNPMMFPMNRFMPTFYPFYPNMPYRQHFMLPMGNRIMFPIGMNEGFRPPNIDSRPQSATSSQNETRRGNHYYTEEARESCDDPFEGFIRHRKPNRGHRQRQSSAAASWRSQ